MANAPPPDDRFYNPDKLKLAFAVSAVVMMVATVWMILDDFGREWKGYQRRFMELKEKMAKEQVEATKKAIDPKALEQLQTELKNANETLKTKGHEVDGLKTELVTLVTKKKNLTAKYQALKGEWDVEKYQYESKWGHEAAEGAEHLPPEAAKDYQVLMKGWDKVLEFQNNANSANQAVIDQQAKINHLYANKVELEKKLKGLNENYDRAVAAEENSQFTLTKLVRSSPIIDLADPVFRVRQVVLPEIRDDIFFAQAQKVDRCTTCHMAIDAVGFENAPQPFRTHPKLDLMLGSRSPHPIDKIGCTICHDGRGQAMDFVRAAHTPRNAEQEEQWKKKYGWNHEDQHHIVEKMIPLQYTEGKCRVCHRETEYVYRAPKLNQSVQMIRSAGCYGCHKMEGWEHLPKSAPALLKVKGKLTRDWMVKWVSDPKSYNEHARMPASFFQSNTKGNALYESYQEAEVQGIADYLLEHSEKYVPNIHATGGNVERGKALFAEVGCLGCHQIDDSGQKHGRWTRAPDLSTVGSKVGKDWLVTWIQNPTHYRPDTTMPSLRLSSGEAEDIAAYLMSKKNKAFEEKKAAAVNTDVQKAVLRLYLLRDPKLSPATETKVTEQLAKFQPHDLSVEIGRRAIGNYGCFGCHQIKGFEGVGGIGPELSTEWNKPLTKFDFGLLHMEHSKISWFEKKFEDPRVFDEGLVKDYLDLLRMPDFHFSKADADELILALVGMTAETPKGKVLAARERKTENGVQVVHKYNCQGCHVMEGLWEPLPDSHPDYEANENKKYGLEGRMLAYYEEDVTKGPPKILQEGFRVQTDFANSFLKDPGHIKLRQGLKVRMPTFPLSLNDRNKILDYWGNQAEVPYPILEEVPVQLTGKQLSDAKALFSKLQCLNCHNLGERMSAEELENGSKGFAPNLRLASHRLRREWMVAFLKNPDKFIPGTRMPGFWVDGAVPVPEILGGDADKQVGLLVDYVISLGQKGSPAAGE